MPIPVRSRLVVDAAEAVLDAGIAGAGIIRLFSYHVADAVKAGALTILLDGFEPSPLPVNIVYLGGAPQPLKVRAFIDFAAPNCTPGWPPTSGDDQGSTRGRFTPRGPRSATDHHPGSTF